MQITSRFTIALHALGCIYHFERDGIRVTSALISSSTGVNPVIVRTVLGQLRTAGIVETKQGSGGAHLAKDLSDVSLYDIYIAVESVSLEGLFHFHDSPNPLCPIGRNIHDAVDSALDAVQSAMESKLQAIKVIDVINNLEEKIKIENEEAK